MMSACLGTAWRPLKAAGSRIKGRTFGEATRSESIYQISGINGGDLKCEKFAHSRGLVPWSSQYRSLSGGDEYPLLNDAIAQLRS